MTRNITRKIGDLEAGVAFNQYLEVKWRRWKRWVALGFGTLLCLLTIVMGVASGGGVAWLFAFFLAGLYTGVLYAMYRVTMWLRRWSVARLVARRTRLLRELGKRMESGEISHFDIRKEKIHSLDRAHRRLGYVVMGFGLILIGAMVVGAAVGTLRGEGIVLVLIQWGVASVPILLVRRWLRELRVEKTRNAGSVGRDAPLWEPRLPGRKPEPEITRGSSNGSRVPQETAALRSRLREWRIQG